MSDQWRTLFRLEYFSRLRVKIVAGLATLFTLYALHRMILQSNPRKPDTGNTDNLISTGGNPETYGNCLPDNYEPPTRAVRVLITQYGGVGDGLTLNTEAFERAMADLAHIDGGAQLHVPTGRWLTGGFSLVSHLTIFLESGAVILGSQNPQHWPLIEPLPSYGSGRERPGKRHTSLLHGQDVVDVWITGENGTIDGQGEMWWEMWRNRTLVHTRGHLVEFMSSRHIVLANVVLRNSPFWTVHPVYCDNFVVKNVTILAPWNAPNTDGIDPDSSSNVCIEDCYISNGDDLISIKSGWDEYGMRVARPSVNITIRRVTGTTATCSGIAIGSEVSGGIENVVVENMRIFNAAAGIRLKTAPGRGGFIRNVTIKGIELEGVKKAIEFSGDAGEHPEDVVGSEAGRSRSHSKLHHNDSITTVVSGIFIQNVVGVDIVSPGRFISSPQAPFVDICLFNISLDTVSLWSCANVFGASSSVVPPLCASLQGSPNTSNFCYSSLP